jgi:hypothetical protein
MQYDIWNPIFFFWIRSNKLLTTME